MTVEFPPAKEGEEAGARERGGEPGTSVARAVHFAESAKAGDEADPGQVEVQLSPEEGAASSRHSADAQGAARLRPSTDRSFGANGKEKSVRPSTDKDAPAHPLGSKIFVWSYSTLRRPTAAQCAADTARSAIDGDGRRPSVPAKFFDVDDGVGASSDAAESTRSADPSVDAAESTPSADPGADRSADPDAGPGTGPGALSADEPRADELLSSIKRHSLDDMIGGGDD